MNDFQLTKALGDAMSDYMTAVETTTDTEASARQLQERLWRERRRRLVVRSGLAIATAAAVVAAVLIVARERDKPEPPITPPKPSPSVANNAFTSRLSTLVGLRLTLPSSEWEADESISEVTIPAPGIPGAKMRIAKGMFPTEPSGGFVETSISARRVIAALREMPALQASRPVRVHLGEGLAAVYTDIRLSPSAPRSGFTYLTYKSNSGAVTVFSIEKGMVVRVYAAVYKASYGKDVLNIAVESTNAKSFAQWADQAADVLQTLHLPKGYVPSRVFGVTGKH
jgi:hypothetical protein